MIELTHASWNAQIANEQPLYERCHDALIQVGSMRLSWYAREARLLRCRLVRHYDPQLLGHAMEMMIHVDFQSLKSPAERMFYLGLVENFAARPTPGQKMHVATHPLAFAFFKAVACQLEGMHEMRLTVQDLSDQLHGILGDFASRGLGRREQNVAYSLQMYCRDMVRMICREALRLEKMRGEKTEESEVA